MGKTLGDITNELAAKVLNPAKEQAEAIVRDAEAKAEEILRSAQREAAQTRESAARDAEHTLRQMHTDMETAARNFLIMVQERLESAIVEPAVAEEVRRVLADDSFLQGVIERIISEFHRTFGREASIELLLPQEEKARLETWFVEKFRAKAMGPVTVQFTDKIAFGFHIGLAGTGSRFNFSTGLEEAFSVFCSPRFRKHFFSVTES